jgi:hypothetical protein
VDLTTLRHGLGFRTALRDHVARENPPNRFSLMWLAIRPRWIVHRCYSGPWRPRRGHQRDLDRSSELLVVKGQIGPPALAHDPGPHHGPLRQRRSTTYSASSATATRRKYSTTRSSTVLIVAARKSMTCILAFDAGRAGAHWRCWAGVIKKRPGGSSVHRHLPFANRFIAMLHASGAASTLQRGGIPHTRPSCRCASVPPDPMPNARAFG